MHKCYEYGETVSMLDDIQFITIPPREEHTATIIWLHGLGDTGKGLAWFAKSLVDSPALAHVKVVLPSAPIMLVTGNKCYMPSWFDCYSFDIPNRREDEEGLLRATRWVNAFIDMESSHCGISQDRIIVGGLSQGGAVALLTGITTERKLAGIFALSTYVPLRKKIPEIASPIASSIPIFWAHGKADLQVDCEFAFSSAKELATQLKIPFRSLDSGLKAEDTKNDVTGIEFHSYDEMGHWIKDEEFHDLTKWIEGLLTSLNVNTDEL